ncbi:hypothetical protein H0H81_009454 [Sphagnurus paluster]|uniref:Uncharacterized protein n=1 Tax=Sphagnurus paluster TaxID=117069 RepID=A0A9P7K5N5_9AGAR|nr:hypothetical protein H0H81_009454 [Sphagnurus paluster]
MATLAMRHWQEPNHHTTTRSPFQYIQPPQYHSMTPEISLPPRNEKDLSRDFLITVLNHFATVIQSYFNGRPVRLVVHGGACMLLHPGLFGLAKEQYYLAHNSPANSPHNILPRRVSTRDVDYIHRSFVTEWQALGVADAGDRLKHCIKLTAQHFQLGLDWMNSDADVALPMAIDDKQQQYDPIYRGAIQPNNVHLHSIFSSTNGLLTLVSVPPVWSIVLKLVRYIRYDPGDICLLLRNGVNLNNMHWTPEALENWIHTEAAPMCFERWSATKRQQLRTRIQHAVQMVTNWNAATARGPVIPNLAAEASRDTESQRRSLLALPAPPPQPDLPSHARTSWSGPSAARRAIEGPTGHGATPDLGEYWPEPKPRSRPNDANHARFELETQKLNRDIAQRLQAAMSPPLAVLRGAEKTTRRTREKKRAKSRERNRRSKFLIFPRPFADSDSDTDSDSDDGRHDFRPVIPRSMGHLQQSQQTGAPFLPRPSAFLIYAPPAATPPPAASLPYPVQIQHLRTITNTHLDPAHRSSATSTPQHQHPEHRRSSSSMSYNLQNRNSFPGPPPNPPIDESDRRRSTASTTYRTDQHERPITPFIPTFPTAQHHEDLYAIDERRSSDRDNTHESSTRARSRSRSRHHSRSVSRAPKDRHRPPPLDLSPSLGDLLVF